MSRIAPSRKIGLARALSKLGYCSRLQAAKLIGAGRVRLNGAIRRDPEFPTNSENDRIEVNGYRVDAAGRVYLMLNKPRGVVTSASDEKGRETVYAYLREEFPWIAPVGRLDKASEGLLLLTNDSEWGSRVTAPETHLDKTYHVQVQTVVNEFLAKKMEEGLRNRENDFLRARRASILRHGDRNTWLEIVLDEGKNRQIRRMLETLNLEVLRLVRVAVGPLALGQLAKGEVRFLAFEEKLALDREMERRSDAAK